MYFYGLYFLNINEPKYLKSYLENDFTYLHGKQW